jgi:hypothetical protein
VVTGGQESPTYTIMAAKSLCKVGRALNDLESKIVLLLNT